MSRFSRLLVGAVVSVAALATVASASIATSPLLDTYSVPSATVDDSAEGDGSIQSGGWVQGVRSVQSNGSVQSDEPTQGAASSSPSATGQLPSADSSYTGGVGAEPACVVAADAPVPDTIHYCGAAETASYVRVTDNGQASIKEVRSVDLLPGLNVTEVTGLAKTIRIDSLLLELAKEIPGVSLRSFETVTTDDEVSLRLEIASNRAITGVELYVSYLLSDLGFAISYTGLLDESKGQLRLDEWVSVDNRTGKDFEHAWFSFNMESVGYGYCIPNDISIQTGEQKTFASIVRVLPSAHILITATEVDGADPKVVNYTVKESIAVDGLSNAGIVIPSAPAKIWAKDKDGFTYLLADRTISKSLTYDTLLVDGTLRKPNIVITRTETAPRDGSVMYWSAPYRLDIDNRTGSKASLIIRHKLNSEFTWLGEPEIVGGGTAMAANDGGSPTIKAEVGPGKSQILYKIQVFARR